MPGADSEADEAAAGCRLAVPEPVLWVLCLEELESELLASVLVLVEGADCCLMCASLLEPGLRVCLSSGTS